MAESDPSYGWKMWVIMFLIIFFLFLLTLALFYYRSLHSCNTNPIIWCYEDWICPSELAGSSTRNPVAATQKSAEDCELQADGSTKGKCENQWDFLNSS